MKINFRFSLACDYRNVVVYSLALFEILLHGNTQNSLSFPSVCPCGELIGEKIDEKKIFEHLIQPVNKEKNRRFASVHPIWLHVVDDVRIHFQNNPYVYIPDFSK